MLENQNNYSQTSIYWAFAGKFTGCPLEINSLLQAIEIYLNSVNCDHPGECSPEKDCFEVTLTDVSTT